MLLERYVAEALTSRFGHVIDGLDCNKMRLSTWKGELEFYDLVLKNDALPVDSLYIAYGRIGTLQIKLPWKLVRQSLWGSSSSSSLSSSSSKHIRATTTTTSAAAATNDSPASAESLASRFKCRVVVSNVNILVAPKPRGGAEKEISVSSNESMDEAKKPLHQAAIDREASIQAGLDAQILRRQFNLERANGTDGARSASAISSWRSAAKKSLLKTLLSNLVVSVMNIHIRYEDPGDSLNFDANRNSIPRCSHRHPAFSVGFLLKSFSVQSVYPPYSDNQLDSEITTPQEIEAVEMPSVPSTAQNDRHFWVQRKLLAIEDLAAYWDSNCNIFLAENDQMSDVNKDFNDLFVAPMNHSFVLHPLSPRMELSLTNLTSESLGEHADSVRQSGGRDLSSNKVLPPHQLIVTSPPFHVNISRRLLQDVGYLRRVYSMNKANNTEVIRQIIHLKRPTATPRQNPRAWWRFVIEAVMIVRKDIQPQGWARLAQAVSKQARYIALYRKLLTDRDDSNNRVFQQQLMNTHAELIQMEHSVLNIEEVVAFRMSVYLLMRNQELPISLSSPFLPVVSYKETFVSDKDQLFQYDSTVSDEIVDTNVLDLPVALSGETVLSLEHRLRMFAELTKSFRRERVSPHPFMNVRIQQRRIESKHVHISSPMIWWVAAVSCSECSLQVDDQPMYPSFKGYRNVPIARLSCALFLNHSHGENGSWKMEMKIGSLKVQDCTLLHTPSLTDDTVLFPTLISNKPCIGQPMMKLCGESFYESIHVVVKRVMQSSSIFSASTVAKTSSVRVRVLPLEIVYATAPVEALLRILSPANQDLANAYHRLSSKVYDWRERLRKRLVQALAHKRKKIIFDVDIGAPVILIPEDSQRNSPMLTIDFGRMLFHNDTRTLLDNSLSFDDKWILELTAMQVQCTTTFMYRSAVTATDYFISSILPSNLQQVVEPFSLDFTISTRFENEHKGRDRQTSIDVMATLPKLAINATSSAIRLMSRLQLLWSKRKSVLRPMYKSIENGSIDAAVSNQPLSERQIEFHFVAPLLVLRLENDVDGRDCSVIAGTTHPKTPLLDLTLKGIEGRMKNERDSIGNSLLSLTFRLRAMYGVDLYQKAGGEFLYLLSSVCPDFLLGGDLRDLTSLDANASASDLVRFSFETRCSSPCQEAPYEVDDSRKVSIVFSELYVEWNPETLAALHFAMRLPEQIEEASVGLPPLSILVDGDLFFDAEDDVFFDANEVDAESIARMNSLLPCAPTHTLTNRVPSEIQFDLSKIRVHFNKESRHRRLLIVEMDRAFVSRKIVPCRGSVTKATIGNLSFSDADHVHDKTLYREILGLKTDALTETEGVGQSSLLEMELIVNPKSRVYLNEYVVDEATKDEKVVINLSERKAYGFDMLAKAEFSPMRFVYIQQVWCEIIDYIFEGILGYEVWGNRQPSLSSNDNLSFDAPNAEKMSFTKFDVVLRSPSIHIPVSYCSTDFLRLDATSISFANFFTYGSMRRFESNNDHLTRLQWFNNCKLEMNSLLFSNSFSRVLNQNCGKPVAVLWLKWPIGQTATINCPKWKVRCEVNELNLTFLREDYALIQHIIQYNLGEESRHLEEWHALQNLPPLVFQRYKEDIKVHFGYDKKDVAPTTFDVEVNLPFLRIHLVQNVVEIGSVVCKEANWSYVKLMDLVSRQKVACFVQIMDLNSHPCASNLREIHQGTVFDLAYTSTTQFCGDNVRLLDLGDLHINFDYSTWRNFVSFFSTFPGPTFRSPKDVIQVGDRWYKIACTKSLTSSTFRQSSSWIPRIEASSCTQVRTFDKLVSSKPTYQYVITLRHSSVVFGSESCSLIVQVDEVALRQVVCPSQIERQVKLDGVQIKTTQLECPLKENVGFLTESWYLCGETKYNSDSAPCACDSQTVVISAEKLDANASFSDLTIAAEVLLRLVRDVRSDNDHNTFENQASKDSNQRAQPRQSTFDIRWDGFSLTVVDDSLRHFAVAQELVVVNLGMIDFHREETQGNSWDRSPCIKSRFFTRLRFVTFDIVDSLQSASSPFQTVVTIREKFASLSDDLSPMLADTDPQFAVELSSELYESREYIVKIGSVDVQYNPSLVIALQRFLGRTSKDVKQRLALVFEKPVDRLTVVSSDENTNGHSTDDRLVIATFCIDYLRLCLNKDHQGRQLLETILSDAAVELSRSAKAMRVNGHLYLFDVFYNANNEVRSIVKYKGDQDQSFIDFRYIKLFQRSDSSLQSNELPDWVYTHLTRSREIDDSLLVTVSAFDVVYDKNLSFEILDYLSNGMPGRGMGMTSRAAKGFVNDRIQTRSFLQMHVDYPRLLVPQEMMLDTAIVISLDCMNLKSWVDSNRFLSLEINGLASSLYDTQNYTIDDEGTMCSDVSMSLHVEKSPVSLLLRARLSSVDIAIRYREWVTLLFILRNNLGRELNRSRWDNLESAWELGDYHESETENETSPSDIRSNLAMPIRFSREVAYASNARVVKFGSHQPRSAQYKDYDIDLNVEFERMSFTLHRDGFSFLPLTDKAQSGYDIALIVFRRLSSSLLRKGSGMQSASVSIGEVFLFDLGSNFRRSSILAERDTATSCCVLVEGYMNGDICDGFDSQIVLTADCMDILPSNVCVSILMNYISIAVLLRPIEEMTNFIACRWKVNYLGLVGRVPISDGRITDRSHTAAFFDHYQVQFKFVLHYPRVIAIADENDMHSRALVLEGLAMLNASLQKQIEIETVDECCILRIHADFLNVSSYINPDTSDAIAFHRRHRELVASVKSLAFDKDPLHDKDSDRFSGFTFRGIPLLLPVSFGLEYEQKTCTSSQSARSLGMRVESLSMKISPSDLVLIQLLLSKLTPKTDKQPEQARSLIHEATFDTDRLGLGLRNEGGLIVVDQVDGVASQMAIEPGDVLHSINGIEVSDSENISLFNVVERLDSLPRPLVITFTRLQGITEVNDIDEVHLSSSGNGDNGIFSDLIGESHDTVDLSLTFAVLTFTKDDLVLFRGTLSSLGVMCNIEKSKADFSLNVCFSTFLDIGYYNLRVWGWEPFLEQSFIEISAELKDSREEPIELSVELGDRDRGPFSFNLSDAAMETLAKLLKSSILAANNEVFDEYLVNDTCESDGIPSLNLDVTKQAANGAFLFAQRQVSDSAKPFVFQNRTGLSIAFVLEGRALGSAHELDLSFALGDYSGLQSYNPADIVVVANEEESKFRVNVLYDTADGIRGRRFPPLTVALQAVQERSISPLRGLNISDACDAMPLPFSFSSSEGSLSDLCVRRNWLSWSVEHADDRTLLTIATSIRIVSLLCKVVEIGVKINDDNVQLIGPCYADVTVFMPVWLAFHNRDWECCFKIPGCDWASLFWVIDLRVRLASFSGSYVKFKSSDMADTSNALSLTVSLKESEQRSTVTIDCSISLRNLLPIESRWQIAQTDVVKSTHEPKYHAEGLLPSGSRAEIFSSGYKSMQLRFRPHYAWSSWISLSIMDDVDNIAQTVSTKQSLKAEKKAEPKIVTLKTRIVDSFGVPLVLAVRVVQKSFCGIDVVVYTDLWLSNCSSLPLVFGCTKEPALAQTTMRGLNSSLSESAAESALKEISSLFEFGDEAKRIARTDSNRPQLYVVDISQIPFQRCQTVTEECFEYVEVESSTVMRRWWASENPNALRENLSAVESTGNSWRWLDKSWNIDCSGRTSLGWESSSSFDSFSEQREFNPVHRYRRRRYYRSRSGDSSTMIENVNGYYQPLYTNPWTSHDTNKSSLESLFRVAMKVWDGKWAMTSLIPSHGTSFGALRISRTRWPKVVPSSSYPDTTSLPTSVYELCYAVSPLDGLWGELSRIFLVSDRFLLTNNSKEFTFEVKQSASCDDTIIRMAPGETYPFHWSNSNLPELLSVRPVEDGEKFSYHWSGGFDPLFIGPIPLRMRTLTRLPPNVADERTGNQFNVQSVQVETEVRPRTGGTGISISFVEENLNGVGSLFRIENRSQFPVWFAQDGLPSGSNDAIDDIVKPSESVIFALDVPFRRGKNGERSSATLADLLRIRLSLAPLLFPPDNELSKVISFAAAGERIRLNPSKLSCLSASLQKTLRRVRVLGIVVNDGPTRVLRLCLMKKADQEILFGNPFMEDSTTSTRHKSSRLLSQYYPDIHDVAQETSEQLFRGIIPGEIDAVDNAILEIAQAYAVATETVPLTSSHSGLEVSFRAAIQGIIFSVIDNAPSEICVISLENLNALASWNTLRSTTSTVYVTISNLQVDNMIPNAPFPVAVSPYDSSARDTTRAYFQASSSQNEPDHTAPPLLVIGVSFLPRHRSGVVCLRSVTIAPRNLWIKVDLAFLVRLQKYLVDLHTHFHQLPISDSSIHWSVPDIVTHFKTMEEAGASTTVRQKFFFGGLTIMPCNIKLSVAPARALTSYQAALEGEMASALHQAVRKGDIKLGDSSVLLGVRVGHVNKSPIAVVRGVFKSIVVDALLRLDGAKLNFAGISLQNHMSTSAQLTTHLGVHYFTSLRQNVPTLLGSLSVFGNPLGLVRSLGDGVSDFVLEPVKGFQRSVQEMDASYLVDGVARGTLSLARHTVGGFADSAAMLTETLSKNMTVLTLDRRYAQKRDRTDIRREQEGVGVNVATGIGSGMQKLAHGFIEGVTGVVKAPLRGAEKKGFEGFAKGIGKGLLGLLVKPIIGISDGLTDVMIGVKGSVEWTHESEQQAVQHHLRPRRALYGLDKQIRAYNVADAAASALMLRTRLTGERYLAHMDMSNQVALLSVNRILILGANGNELQELLVLKYKHIERLEVREVKGEDGINGWRIIVILNTRRRNGSEIEVISCNDKNEADELIKLIEQGMKLISP